MPLLTLLAVLGCFFGYPNPLLHVPAAMLLFPAALAWMAFRAATPGRALRWGYLAGILGHTACLYWIAGPVAQYGGLPWWLALPCPFGVSLVMGLYSAAFCWCLNRAARRLSPLFLCIFAGLLWTALEMLGSWLFTGFPWVTLSAAFAPWPVFIQTASLLGAYGLSGLFAALAVAFVLFKSGTPVRIFAIGMAVVLLSYGSYRMAGYSPSGPTKRISLIQGNIDQSEKWEASFQIGTVEKYLQLSRESMAEHKPDLIVWPETAMPFYFQDANIFSNQVAEFTHQTGIPLLLGSPAYEPEDNGSFSFYNRAFLLNPSDTRISWYDKVHLVPFGEYVPLEDWLPVEKLASGVGDYKPGYRLEPLRAADMNLGVLICYEAIFPELAQARVASGADLLVNISNDAWFGRSSAPWQHLAQARMRAVEQGRWMVRGTNTGITAFIDPLGRLEAATGLFEDKVLTWEVKTVHVTTVYHDIQSWLNITVNVLTGLFLVWIIFAPRLRSRVD